MKIYISKPGIISSAGDSNSIIENLNTKNRFLTPNDEFISGKTVYLGQIKDKLENIPKNMQTNFGTRTNALLLNAALQIKNEIDYVVKNYKKIGIIVATTVSGVEENFLAFKNNYFDKTIFNISKNQMSNCANFLSEFLNIPHALKFGISSACTSGSKAIIQGLRLIKSGIIDIAIVSGSDALCKLTINGFNSLNLLSDKFCNPFSINSDGINIGEGAAIFVLSKDKISDTIILSAKCNQDAYHITKPREDGYWQSKLIKDTLREADIKEPDYINLHATGSGANEIMEATAIKNTNLDHVVSSGIKSQIGHTLGAAGAIETAICVKILNQNTQLPPHIYDGIYNPDIPKISLSNTTTKTVKTALSLSFAFGGDNASVLVGADDE